MEEPSDQEIKPIAIMVNRGVKTAYRIQDNSIFSREHSSTLLKTNSRPIFLYQTKYISEVCTSQGMLHIDLKSRARSTVSSPTAS